MIWEYDSFSYVGGNSAKINQSGHSSSPAYGILKKKDFQRGDSERFMRKLVIDGYLREEMHIAAHDQAVCYVKVGQKAFEILGGRKKVWMMKAFHSTDHFLTLIGQWLS